MTITTATTNPSSSTTPPTAVHTGATTGDGPGATRPRTRRGWPLEARWALSALAFPPAGFAAIALTPVDGAGSALVGGAVAGVVIGAGQWLALRSSEVRPGLGVRWIAATALAMAVGLAAGATAVGYRTTLADLVLMGLITGAFLGPAQAAVLRTGVLTTRVGAVVWATTVPLLWAAGWFVTTTAGIDVERQYSVFGLLGALTASALGGLVLGRLLDRSRT